MAGAASENLIEDLLRAARHHLAMDVAFVSEFAGGQRVFRVVDADTETAVVCGGGDPLEETYCQRIVDGVLPGVIPDTSLEPEARALAVTEALGIGAYVGVPLNFSDGRTYGTLCCFGHEAAPSLDESDRRYLAVVADVVAAQLERTEQERAQEAEAESLIGTLLYQRNFHPVFQPIVELATGRVVGVEALTRFTVDPEIGADGWFNRAALAGSGIDLELAALVLALDQIDQVPEGAYLSVNLSPAAVPAAVPVLLPLAKKGIVLEVTEHEEIVDYDTFLGVIAELREAGIRLAVDDAGAGYASLRHVLRLTPDIVKLDNSLTRGIEDDLALQALAKALVEFATKLSATVVAEGVESAAQLECLAGLGVACGQGYHLGRPGDLPLSAN
jgi:EAL domain-containing protein (putative c-di-GMP-specific phosphodiesterase class I)